MWYNPDTTMGLSRLDTKIALYYAQKLVKPIKYGESGVFFWFPGGGMTSEVRDVFGGKAILRQVLGGLASRLVVCQLWGHICLDKTAVGLLQAAGYESFTQLEKMAEETVQKGKELVVVIGRIDDFGDSEKISILRQILKVNSINRRRIHVIINSYDKPSFERILADYPELLSLGNCLEIMPVLTGNLLSEYVETRCGEFEFAASAKTKEMIKKDYGGWLRVTKEFIRSKGLPGNLELKLGMMWKSIPADYRGELLKAVKNRAGYKSKVWEDLEKFGVTELQVFTKHKQVFVDNPELALSSYLTQAEMAFWTYVTAHAGQVVEKETVIELLRPNNTDEVSLWVVDQAMSRFRKKLARVGVDPDQLKTIKGRGYKWR
jgi:hypothetical protein